LIRKESRILEFGSGMSTVWLASRCGFLHSIESDWKWYAAVSQLLKRGELTPHVRYELRDDRGYCDLAEYADGFFDLCIVDGLRRADCIAQAVSKLRSGGHLYWDNSDFGDGDSLNAGGVLMDAVAGRNGTVQYFVGFPPAAFHVCQGVLARL
jgi:predicted O-methyltransferase YrrM